MGENRTRTFKAENLTLREWNLVEDARRDAERTLETGVTNKELLLLLVNDTAPSWRKGR